MAHAYTPGLKVVEYMTIRKDRRLPLPGEILTEKGTEVKAEDVVAQTDLPGNVQTLNVAGRLGILPEEIEISMLKKAGDEIRREEIIAESKGFFSLFKSQVRAPIDGIVESVSKITGQVILREPPIRVKVNAYIDGTVVDVLGKEGVTIESYGSFIQGIFGVGGEVVGLIKMVVGSAGDPLTSSAIDENCHGKILIGGSGVDREAISKAASVGALGIVVGGIDDRDLRGYLGYDIGVAITGQEDVPVTLIITEGFGSLRMADRTFELLSRHEGMKASINGATQIRAGVIRPEVIVPLERSGKKERETMVMERGLTIGMPVRIIREPYFGKLGRVAGLPVELTDIETEAKVRVLEVELEDKTKVLLPRANVEIIEG